MCDVTWDLPNGESKRINFAQLFLVRQWRNVTLETLKSVVDRLHSSPLPHVCGVTPVKLVTLWFVTCDAVLAFFLWYGVVVDGVVVIVGAAVAEHRCCAIWLVRPKNEEKCLVGKWFWTGAEIPTLRLWALTLGCQNLSYMFYSFLWNLPHIENKFYTSNSLSASPFPIIRISSKVIKLYKYFILIQWVPRLMYGLDWFFPTQ